MSGQPHLVPSGPRGGVDASALPEHGFGPSTPSWWGTIAFMVIEGFTLLICITAYFYLRRNFDSYPPHGFASPDLLISTINVAVMLLSIPVAVRVHEAAHAKDAYRVARSTAVLLGFGVVVLVLRAFELNTLNVRWDSNAYGSIVWFTVGFHTLLLLIDFGESLAIGLIFLLGKEEEKHFTDASDDVQYWYFVVGAWIVVYGVIFLSPRLL